MAETLKGMKRTHRCTELTTADVGKEVVVMGWVQRRRDLGKLIFVTLRDRSGIIQVVFNSETNPELHEKASQVRSEYVLAVRGTLARRSEEAINRNMVTGEIEIIASELRILNKSEVPPFHIEENVDANEALRLKYRYLDLRRPHLQRNLHLRHRIAKIARDYYDDNGFYEIETPFLTKSTPEGARDYLVPSRVHPGKFYALPQSPQIFKQLLMVSGFDRYMQIVKCFRDEDLRADRQPEFTQIDLEMSFVDMEDVIAVNEGFISRLFRETLGLDIPVPFKRLTYKEAMERYGSDKPDTRFGLELVNISDLVAESGFKVFRDAVENGGSVRAINAKGAGAKFSRKEIDALGEVVKTYKAKGLAWMVVEAEGLKSPIAKFLTETEIGQIKERLGAEPGDLLLFVADKDEIVFDALGHLRLELGEKLGLIDHKRYDVLWVTEFPLLEYDEEEQRWVAKHHPFTAPMDEDIDYLDTDPGRVRSKAYDMVINGYEVGGGSIRIHSQELQARMFRVIGLSDEQAGERFGFMLDAFKYGTPPHGGMAFGLDRLTMLLAGTDNIRDVIAFPKVQTAACLMSNAPDVVDEKQLEELHIKTTVNDKSEA
ncbi:aspartate--tRNA ligase [Thermoclostridium caenicola]|uniref:Aspartate--tRNA ligase n=1 Tax=Thermoclostridium caenicola TaxID=659425 RepID=A0A1M6FCK3_9FIRM|nr:aspartate--tRNA ligase [Thermoclostridium caenicola]SHI95402.1 aspartyl-tRNA synthetase [Thermoclostridium caenicola]HOL85025.1 aspartate--tRNA ligase [Thermoclostridium caenicola]HOP72457.1 aspartate--tRNA ligase [Thermoclostridium caenicola]HPO76976.1 aspartate--tRNA ligase [Thermoclostridium caenicola]HPU21383.1 aspartate--tRNA ligase [Thermoclostridium caenicola]